LAYWHQPYLRPAALNRLVAVQALNEDGRLVTGQSKPWFEPQVEDDYVHQEQPLQPVQIVDANGRPIGQSKPWFAPAIEEQQGLRQIAPFLNGADRASLLRPAPMMSYAYDGVDGSEQLVGPLYEQPAVYELLPAAPSKKQPKPYGSRFGQKVRPQLVLLEQVQQQEPAVDPIAVQQIYADRLPELQPSMVQVVRPLIHTLLPGEFDHIKPNQQQQQQQQVDNEARFLFNLFNTTTTNVINGTTVTIVQPTLGGYTATRFIPFTSTVGPLCLNSNPVVLPSPTCSFRRKRDASGQLEEENADAFILVDGKKFTPSEVQKLLSTQKPQFDDFDEERRPTAVALAGLVSSKDDDDASLASQVVDMPSLSRPERFLFTTTINITTVVYSTDAALPINTVTFLGGTCIPKCLATLTACPAAG
jgi:hypothetical protein